jgi:hypothetical protein
MVRDAIEDRIDLALYHEQQQHETEDKDLLSEVKVAVEEVIT